MSLTVRILIGMAAGFLLGSILHAIDLADDAFVRVYLVDGLLDLGGQYFIASLKLMVVPVVLITLVCGASNISDGSTMGRVGGKTLILYLATTAIAITLALSVAIVVGPGEGVDAPTSATFEARESPGIKQTFLDIFPTNPVAAMANGAMLQIIVFAVLLGIAIARAGDAGLRVKGVFEDLNAVVMKLVTLLIELAPYGVFCIMTVLFTSMGLAEILPLGKYFFTVVCVLLLHALLVYPLLLAVLARVSPITYLKKMRQPMMVAFSTSSSNATLPVTLRTVEKRVGVKNEIASFTVPLGATINMDGTAIMQGVATVFIAQYFAQGLEAADYLLVVLTATLASIGTAGVPGVGLIMLAMVLTQVGLPVEGIALILGVDRLLDMMRTAVNITGDGAVSTVVARSEGKLDMAVFEDPDAGHIEDDPVASADTTAESAPSG